MRVILEGLRLETAAYSEGPDINFTFYTADDDLGLTVNEALCGDGRVLEMQRGGEDMLVRVREHEVTPPYARRYSGAIHRHSVCLEQVGAAALPFPVLFGRLQSPLAAAAR